MLRLEGIKTFYGNIQALKGVSVEVNEGEIICLIGSNGAGKSTTLMSISGIVPPREGEIYFQDKPISKLAPDAIVSLGIVQVPEGRHIFPGLSVQENLDMGALLRRDKDEIAKDLSSEGESGLLHAAFEVRLGGYAVAKTTTLSNNDLYLSKGGEIVSDV